MTSVDLMVIAAAALAVLAIVAWASAWKTLEWLGDAEDLIDQLRSRDRDGDVFAELRGYRRRSPQRRR